MRKYFIILYLSLTYWGMAQETENRFITGLNIRKDLNRKISLHLNGQMRFTDGFNTSAYRGEVGVGLKLNSHWDVAAFYRYGSREKWKNSLSQNVFKPYQQFYSDLSYHRNILWFRFEDRFRYQHQFKLDNDVWGSDKSYFRNKVELSYPNKSLIKPYISSDLFFKLGDTFNQVRYKAGAEIRMNKHNSVDVSTYLNNHLGSTQKSDFLIGVIYKLKL